MIGVLRTCRLPFLVTGGLAARAYGSARPLHDIDLYVPGRGIAALLPRIESHLVDGPRRHVDEHWDITFLKLEYHGQTIEIGDADDVAVVDHRTGEWVTLRIDFFHHEMKEIFGLTVPVHSRRSLVAYKRLLARAVDREDLRFIDVELESD